MVWPVGVRQIISCELVECIFNAVHYPKAKSQFFDGEHRCICCIVTHDEEGCCQKFMSPEEFQLLFAHLPLEERAEKMFKWVLQKMEE